MMLVLAAGGVETGSAQSPEPAVKAEAAPPGRSANEPDRNNLSIPISRFNERFPVMSLAEELAEEMENLPPEKRNAWFFKLPAGLRMFVILKCSLETKTLIRDEAFAQFAQRFPDKKPVLTSLQEKYRLFDPILHELAAGGILYWDVGLNFVRSLTPDEIRIMGEIDGYLLGPTFYLQYHETVHVTPAGMDFLKSRAGSSQAARRFLEVLEKDPGQTFRPGKDRDDGFFFLPVEK